KFDYQFLIDLLSLQPQTMNNYASTFLNPKCTSQQLDLFIHRKSILKALNKKLANFHGHVLDVGCGQMPYKSLLVSSKTDVTKYIGLDFEVNPIHNNNPDIVWEDNKIPLADNTIDCSLATEVLEHCPNPEEVLDEIHRVLKPGGFFFFTVPFLWPLHEVPFDQYRYTPFALKRHMGNSGFVNIELRALGGWDASLAQMLGLWVRRRPGLNPLFRKLLSIVSVPLISYLHKIDKKPEVFCESSMITGLCGLAQKANNQFHNNNSLR
ncbi:class I SAM-dependent methyltransferase, partial [Thermodesulfobacteriota bacterium]